MELSQLRYFKTVAEMEHFTRAAEALHISQPSLSKAIASLEAELSVTLFERNRRTVHLNENGQALLAHVTVMLNELEEAQAEIRDLNSGEGGDIRIASCAVFSEPSPIHAFTERFFLEHPAIGVHVYIQTESQIREMLQDRQVDFGYSINGSCDADIDSIELMSYRLGLVVSRRHPLADRKSVRLSEFAAERFLCNNTSIEQTDSIYELCHHAGFEPHVAFEGESASLIGSAISRGLGVGFISEDRYAWQQDKFDWIREVTFLPVEDDYCRRTVYLRQRKERYLSPAARRFRDGLLAYAAQERREK